MYCRAKQLQSLTWEPWWAILPAHTTYLYYITYFLDQTPWLLFISSRNFVRLLFKSSYYLRAAFIKLCVLGKIFRNYKGFEKSQFYMENCNAAWSATALLQSGIPTWHFQSVSSFSSNDFTRWSLSVPQKMPNSSEQRAFLYLSCTPLILPFEPEVCSCAHVLLLVAASIREQQLFRSARPEVRRQFESGD